MAIDFKGVHSPKDVILFAVFFYVRYAVSYRDLEEIMAERGVGVDHATLSRWVVKFAPMVAVEAQRRKSSTSSFWRMDETYIKIKSVWTYLYRAVDKHGKTPDSLLSERRDEAAATTFFASAITNNGWPEKVVIERAFVRHRSKDTGERGANHTGLETLNWLPLLQGWFWLIDICCVKYLNNIIEQDHRFIKKLTRPTKGVKSFRAASATLAGIEGTHMIHKGEFEMTGKSAFQQFAELAA